MMGLVVSHALLGFSTGLRLGSHEGSGAFGHMTHLHDFRTRFEGVQTTKLRMSLLFIASYCADGMW